MSETEPSYRVDYEHQEHGRPAESLPECETGSVERMLEAAIVWHCKIWAEDKMRNEKETNVIISQEILLQNILAKMEQARVPEPRPEPCGWLSGDHCPNCGASIRVTLEFSATTHG